LPSESLRLVRDQLESLVSQDRQALSVGFVVALVAALWSANNGMKTLFEALNIAYEEREKRSFIRLNLVALAFTLGAMAVGALLFIVIGVVPAALSLLRFGPSSDLVANLLRWPLTLVVLVLGVSVLY